MLNIFRRQWFLLQQVIKETIPPNLLWYLVFQVGIQVHQLVPINKTTTMSSSNTSLPSGFLPGGADSIIDLLQVPKGVKKSKNKEERKEGWKINNILLCVWFFFRQLLKYPQKTELLLKKYVTLLALPFAVTVYLQFQLGVLYCLKMLSFSFIDSFFGCCGC